MTLPRYKNTFLTAAAASALLLTAACGSEATDDDSSAATAPAAAGGSADSADADPSAASSGGYAAGDYSAEGSYQTPGGTQSVVVELSLDATGTITSVEVIPQADGGNSEQFQGRFAGGIADEVEGVSIDDLDVSKVSGSSLTSGGFNKAIDEIKAQAAA
ncbi:hypothetical protein HMPREF0063_12715 [Aeromicrobium marinum DSM 15272]|uniref:FMN-binding domain-containing protein n=1 Tax=Aeromicrobium marinum DSM 15272 TaxID=585531 RepID=E2SFA6_9ACTN|nr:FMN-binding protein [Aeromicrobium marinum]EFQ82191.1 hypothetical protein HMPREF0063_12715 [Aeromicrobium marinum DSM 15272]